MSKKLIIPALIFAIHGSSFAYVITYNVGPAWYAPYGKQVLNLDIDTLNTYTINNAPLTLINNELFFAKQAQLKSNLAGQIGFSLNHNSNAKIGGDIWQEASPEFNNFNYDYYVSHSAVTIKGKLLFTKFNTQPYISASAGVARNRAFAFNQTAKISEAVTSYSFTANSLAAFTYTVEAGVQHMLSNNWAVGLGYEFADLGKSKLGPAYLQPNNNVPYLNYLYINQLQFNISYFLNEQIK